jgi:hypothetical protein
MRIREMFHSCFADDTDRLAFDVRFQQRSRDRIRQRRWIKTHQAPPVVERRKSTGNLFGAR